jgi:hypothetical protein
MNPMDVEPKIDKYRSSLLWEGVTEGGLRALLDKWLYHEFHGRILDSTDKCDMSLNELLEWLMKHTKLPKRMTAQLLVQPVIGRLSRE